MKQFLSWSTCPKALSKTIHWLWILTQGYQCAGTAITVLMHICVCVFWMTQQQQAEVRVSFIISGFLELSNPGADSWHIIYIRGKKVLEAKPTFIFNRFTPAQHPSAAPHTSHICSAKLPSVAHATCNMQLWFIRNIQVLTRTLWSYTNLIVTMPTQCPWRKNSIESYIR